VFVAIFTAPNEKASLKRGVMRDHWRQVGSGALRITTKFVVCHSSDSRIENEQRLHGDFLFLDCEEGYEKGLLTRKLLASMKTYLRDYSQFDLFMKADDDTFISPHRFSKAVFKAWSSSGNSMYFGVQDDGLHPEPIRDPNNKWYEPIESFPDAKFPDGMMGGPGYMLGGSLVQKIIDEGIGEANVLWNEDRATSVWVRELQRKGADVEFVGVNGTNGFSWDNPVCSGTWDNYPYVMAHALSVESIRCLMELARVNNANALIDHCFKACPVPWEYSDVATR
jgi:hypothetical protein